MAKFNPIHTADSSTISAITVYISANAICTPSRRGSRAAYSLDAGARLAQLRDDARIETAHDVKINVVVVAQLDDGGDVIGIRYDRDLRFVLVQCRQRLLRRRDEILGIAAAGALDHVEVAVDDHGRRQTADRGLRGQKLVKALAVVIEQRLRAAQCRAPSP